LSLEAQEKFLKSGIITSYADIKVSLAKMAESFAAKNSAQNYNQYN